MTDLWVSRPPTHSSSRVTELVDNSRAQAVDAYRGQSGPFGGVWPSKEKGSLPNDLTPSLIAPQKYTNARDNQKIVMNSRIKLGRIQCFAVGLPPRNNSRIILQICIL
jgi:hypothetical protein